MFVNYHCSLVAVFMIMWDTFKDEINSVNFFFFIFYNFRSRHLKVDCMGSSNHHHSQLISLRKNDDWSASMCGELLMGSLGVRAFNTISFLRLLRLHHRHHYQHYQYSMSKMCQRQFVIVNCYISLNWAPHIYKGQSERWRKTACNHRSCPLSAFAFWAPFN